MKWGTIGLITTITVTVVTLAVWVATDTHYYTKFEVVEQVEKEIDPNDPLAQAGFYEEGKTNVVTEHRDEFHLGLFPTPSGLLDKNMLSVLSLITPFWVIYGGLFWWERRKARLEAASAPISEKG